MYHKGVTDGVQQQAKKSSGKWNHWLRREGSKDEESVHLRMKFGMHAHTLEGRYHTLNSHPSGTNAKRNLANYLDVSTELKVRCTSLFAFPRELNMS